MRAASIPYLFLGCLFLFNSGILFAQSSITLDKVLEVQIDELPVIGKNPGANIANGYTGIISDIDTTTKQNEFWFFNREGEKVYSLKSKKGCAFCNINMPLTSEIIVLGEWVDDGFIRSYVVNYDGRLLFPPIEEEALLISSPGNSYYTTDYNTFSGSLPKIYNCNGELVKKLDADKRLWDLKPLTDSLILFLCGTDLKLLSYPSFEVEKSLSFPHLLPPYTLKTAISSNGNIFAFSCREKIERDSDQRHIVSSELGKIVICNLADGDTYKIYCHQLRPNMVLSPDGSYLLLYNDKGREFSVYKFDSDKYVHLDIDAKLEPSGNTAYLCRTPEFLGDCCIVNWFYGSVKPVEYRSCLFKYTDPIDLTVDILPLEVFLRPGSNTDSSELYLLEMHPDESEKAIVTKVKLKTESID